MKVLLHNKIPPSKKRDSHCGFTLIELMVAVSIFTLVMTISMGSILAVFDANKKSQTLRAVMDNVNFTLEGMTRAIRFGRDYHCGSGGDTAQPFSCDDGRTSLSVLDQNGKKHTYTLNTITNRIERTIDDRTPYPVTSPDVTINKLTFYVLGAYPYCSLGCSPTDMLQPRVIMVVGGHSGVKPNIKSSFSLQTTVSQRAFDFQ